MWFACPVLYGGHEVAMRMAQWAIGSHSLHGEKALASGRRHDLIRIGAGLLLVAAGALKGYVATSPLAGSSLLFSRWFLIGAVECEIVLGLWLVCGLAPRVAWRAALAAFAAFAGVSLYRGLTGAESCGCFGALSIGPWWTFAGDVAAVCALAWWWPPRPGAG